MNFLAVPKIHSSIMHASSQDHSVENPRINVIHQSSQSCSSMSVVCAHTVSCLSPLHKVSGTNAHKFPTSHGGESVNKRYSALELAAVSI